jgi:hypothetical protein
MKPYSPVLWVSLPLAVLFVFTGCNKGRIPDLVQYQGVVTYMGEPLTEAHINFIPTDGKRHSAYATTDSSGRFRVSTLDPNDGIVKGEYQVCFSKNVVAGFDKLPGGIEEPIYANLLPVKYGPGKSPIMVEVKKKDTNVKFDLID